MQYSDWEQEIVDLIASDLEVSQSDAAAVVEAQSFYMQQSWTQGLSAEQAATKIIAAGIAH